MSFRWPHSQHPLSKISLDTPSLEGLYIFIEKEGVVSVCLNVPSSSSGCSSRADIIFLQSTRWGDDHVASVELFVGDDDVGIGMDMEDSRGRSLSANVT